MRHPSTDPTPSPQDRRCDNVGEIALWQRWNEAEQDPATFQSWLDDNDPNFGGFTRRVALERNMFDQVRSIMDLAVANTGAPPAS